MPDEITARDLPGTGGEAVFLPSRVPEHAEDDAWLLSITTTRDGRRASAPTARARPGR